MPTSLIVSVLVAAFTAVTTGSAAGQTPKPSLLVLNKAEATMVVVNPATNQIVGKVATGEGPHEVVTDGARAYVGNYGAQTPGSSLSVIDLATLKETIRFDLGPLRRPHGLALVDGKVYLTAETNRLVARYDTALSQIDWVMGTGQAGTHMVWVHATGTPVITTNIGSNSVTVMERGANPMAWSVTQIATGEGPEGLDVSPDGSELWAAHSRDGGVSIIDLVTKKVVHTIGLGTKRSNRLKFTLDGARVLITDLDAGDLVVVDAKTRVQLARLPLGPSPEGILMAPDGAHAYVAVTGDNHVAVVDLRTLTVTATIETGTGPDGMAWVQ
jgi:YVTN family beta-propeller protein